jgi:hypothetical protein
MGNFEAPQRAHSLNPLGNGQDRRRKIEKYTIERGELCRVSGEETAQRRDLRVACGLGVEAEGPKAALFPDRSPELLRNPGESALKERNARKTIG